MTRSVKIQMEQYDDGSVDAWFREQPSLKVHGTTLDEVLGQLMEVMDEFKANGGDPTTLAVEDTDES